MCFNPVVRRPEHCSSLSDIYLRPGEADKSALASHGWVTGHQILFSDTEELMNSNTNYLYLTPGKQHRIFL